MKCVRFRIPCCMVHLVKTKHFGSIYALAAPSQAELEKLVSWVTCCRINLAFFCLTTFWSMLFLQSTDRGRGGNQNLFNSFLALRRVYVMWSWQSACDKTTIIHLVRLTSFKTLNNYWTIWSLKEALNEMASWSIPANKPNTYLQFNVGDVTWGKGVYHKVHWWGFDLGNGYIQTS